MTSATTAIQPDSRAAWMRLAIALAIGTIGNAGMWIVSVALPPVQAEFGATRAEASLPYTLTLLGFAFGGVLMGRLSDRFGIMLPLLFGSVSIALGYIAAGLSGSLLEFSLAQGILIGLLGSSATFGPLIANTSLWFEKRRGIAVALVSSGNYLAGAIWPPIIQYFFDTVGWRTTFIGIGVFSVVTMLPLAWMLRGRPPGHSSTVTSFDDRPPASASTGLSSNQLLVMLAIAGVSCCVAMSMPQVHIVAYCADLGFGAATGANMLAMMLGLGLISRLATGWIADKLGGLRALLVGTSMQGLALLLFIPFDSLLSLYLIAALFGLVQGGIVPSYAIIVREYFSPREAGAKVGIVLMATLLGMAFGGWLSGKIFDITGSYDAAFANGVAWNVLNLCIVVWLLRRRTRPFVPA
jgi:MFS family permease